MNFAENIDMIIEKASKLSLPFKVTNNKSGEVLYRIAKNLDNIKSKFTASPLMNSQFSFEEISWDEYKEAILNR